MRAASSARRRANGIGRVHVFRLERHEQVALDQLVTDMHDDRIRRALRRRHDLHQASGVLAHLGKLRCLAVGPKVAKDGEVAPDFEAIERASIDHQLVALRIERPAKLIPMRLDCSKRPIRLPVSPVCTRSPGRERGSR